MRRRQNLILAGVLSAALAAAGCAGFSNSSESAPAPAAAGDGATPPAAAAGGQAPAGSAGSGSAGASGAAASPAAPVKRAPVTVKLMTWANTEQAAAFKKTLAKLTAQTGITVELVTVPSDYPAKVNSLMLAKQLPDVFFCSTTDTSFTPLASNGSLYDWTPYLNGSTGPADSRLDPGKFGAGYLKLYQQKGKQLGIPNETNVNGVFYNERLLKAAGLAIPTADWTWDDLFTYASKLTTKKGDKTTPGLVAGLLDLYSPQGISMYSVSNGGQPMSPQATTWNDVTSINSDPKIVEGMQRFAKAIGEGSITGPDFKPDTSIAAFMNGQQPLLFGGQWFTAFFGDGPKDPWGFVPMPKGSGGHVTNLQANGFCSPSNVKDPDAAWTVISYMLRTGFNEAYQELGITAVPYLPGSEGYFAYLANKKQPGYDTVLKAVKAELANPSKQGTAFLDPWANKANDQVKAIWNPTLNGKKPPEQGVQEFIDNVSKLIR